MKDKESTPETRGITIKTRAVFYGDENQLSPVGYERGQRVMLISGAVGSGRSLLSAIAEKARKMSEPEEVVTLPRNYSQRLYRRLERELADIPKARFISSEAPVYSPLPLPTLDERIAARNLTFKTLRGTIMGNVMDFSRIVSLERSPSSLNPLIAAHFGTRA